jgi:hypothetical protein
MTKTAAGLFIWAETVARFINSGQPKRRLGLVLDGAGTSGVAALYEQILSTSFRDLEDDKVSDLCPVIGTIILAKTPLSFSSLTYRFAKPYSPFGQLDASQTATLDVLNRHYLLSQDLSPC